MRKALYILILAAVIFTGCSTGLEPIPALSPQKAVLSFPKQNALCTQGTVASATQSSLVFKWLNAANSDSYQFHLKNLLTGVTTTSTAGSNQLEVTLNVNTPYSWSVTSKSSKTTDVAESDTWKFYNSGPGTLSYAPYPAEIIVPSMKQNVNSVGGVVTLSWNGSDVDNDIASYDVYLGTTSTPAMYKSSISTTILTDVPVTPGMIYYWKVTTKDTKGNTSDSGIFQFKVN
jgi:hypothetical protein